MKALNFITTIFALFFVSLLMCANTKADTAQIIMDAEQQIMHRAQLSYTRIIPIHEQNGFSLHITIKSPQTNYVLIQPEQPDETEEVSQLPNRKPSSFFERASLFNDKLQSWLN